MTKGSPCLARDRAGLAILGLQPYRMMEVLNVRSNAELIQYAVRKSLVSSCDPQGVGKLAPASIRPRAA
jgi:hypothetical protein